jgi:hypothetical protein
MNLNEVKFGEVVYNSTLGDYARVVGYKEVDGKIRVLVTGGDDPWDPAHCRKQTEREKGNDISDASPHFPDAETLEREV